MKEKKEKWVCKCGKPATLHRTTNGPHEYLCNDCQKKEWHDKN